MEMKENIYPKLPNPSAPPIDESDDKGHSYKLRKRLKKRKKLV